MAKALPVSPLAPAIIRDLPTLRGVRLATGNSGLRYKGRDDLLIMAFDAGTSVAGVFTLSATRAAPVDWCRDILPNGQARALVVNAGNANAFTGSAGPAFVAGTVDAAAAALGVARNTVFIASTGVIGEPLPADGLAQPVAALAPSVGSASWLQAAQAFSTTDTFPKTADATAAVGDKLVQINGIAKGSGMIEPNMATMLGFLATDAAVPASVLQTLLRRAVDRSFNAVTVDGDTSTNDTVLAFATGVAGNRVDADPDAPLWADFARALTAVSEDLARQIARDGEGAQKLITITVTGAMSDSSARAVAKTCANSPLLKTAIAGEDANWGRVVAAIGRSGQPVDRETLTVGIGGVTIASRGERVTGYDEAPVAAHMRGRDILIDIDLGMGPGTATVWTCDLTHGYISINADYRS
jgi:glutamate N-acetyltransferase / amino-acid N-acetyltransferase